MRIITLAAFAVSTMGCTAHQRLQHRNGCWVRTVESRWGDTREDVAVCAPGRPSLSHDPMTRPVEVCLHQAQLAWYADAVQRLRLNKEVPPLPFWNAATARCLLDAQRAALAEVDKLKAQVAGLETRARDLRSDNNELRGALVTCAEKTPNAIAEARATTESSSDSDASGKGSGRARPTATKPVMTHPKEPSRPQKQDCPPPASEARR